VRIKVGDEITFISRWSCSATRGHVRKILGGEQIRASVDFEDPEDDGIFDFDQENVYWMCGWSDSAWREMSVAAALLRSGL
jgi:hypothetical protein